MGKRGPKPAVIPGTDIKRSRRVEVVFYRDHWDLFTEQCRAEGISPSHRLRQLMARDLRAEVTA